MSISHEAHKMAGEMRRAISSIAQKGNLDLDGATRGTRKIVGYVCAIHEDGELAGTIDVQEYNFEPDEYQTEGTRHHKGVLLSAIQDNSDGVLIVPMLFSEVVIVQNPTDGHEYVLMYSHAKRIQLNAHEDIEIGVTEVEDFVETDNGLQKDYDELEPTKNKTSTHYNTTSIVDTIISPEDEVGFREEKTVEHKIITVGNTIITINGENVLIETSGKIEYKIGETVISEEDGAVTVKTNDINVECANCNVKSDSSKIEAGNVDVKGDNIKVEAGNVEVKGSTITLTGGMLKTRGQSTTDLQGPFNPIKVCPFSGAPHCGSTVSGT